MPHRSDTPPTPAETLDLLRRCPLFWGVSKEGLHALANDGGALEWWCVPGGDSLPEHGAAARGAAPS